MYKLKPYTIGKNNRTVIGAILLCALTLTGCADTYDRKTAQALSIEQEQSIPAEVTGAAARKSSVIGLVEEFGHVPEQAAAEVKIYFSNETADGLIEELIPMEELLPEEILRHLSGKNIVSIDTKLNSFEVDIAEGKSLIKMDLNKFFGEYLATMGTGGEQIIMAALVNTFLEAYDAEEVLITVEGETLKSMHQVYEEPIVYIRL